MTEGMRPLPEAFVLDRSCDSNAFCTMTGPHTMVCNGVTFEFVRASRWQMLVARVRSWFARPCPQCLADHEDDDS